MLLFWVLLLPSAARADAPVSFDRQIRPILAKQCLGCHQPSSRQADLSLASYDELIKGGRKGSPIVPGNPDQSLLISRLTGQTTPQMPFGGRPLPDDQIELIRRWIREGAKNDSTGAAAPAPVVRTDIVYHAPPLVTALAWSPDGKLLGVGAYHEIVLHDSERVVARLPGLSPRLHSIAFTPDGATLVAAGGDPARFGELQIWDVAARKQRHSVMLTNDTLYGASISPDGTKVAFACGPEKSLRIYDIATGKEIRKMDHHEDWAFGTVWGIDGKRIVSVGRDRAAKLIDANTGAFLENVNLLREPLTVIARHPKKDWVLIGGQERIPYLYRMDRPRAMRIADDSTLIRKYDRQDGTILALAISPDGQYLAVGAEVGDVHVYNLDTGEQAAKCTGHQGGTYAVQFDPKSKYLAAAGFDGTVRIYELNGNLAKSFVPVPVERASK